MYIYATLSNAGRTIVIIGYTMTTILVLANPPVYIVRYTHTAMLTINRSICSAEYHLDTHVMPLHPLKKEILVNVRIHCKQDDILNTD